MKKEKFLVAEMKETEKTIVKLKASLYSLSIDELVKKAVNNFEGSIENMTCSYCNEGTSVSKKKPKEFQQQVAGQIHVVKVLNYPLRTCSTCGAEFDDMNCAVYTGDLVRNHILESLKTRRELPTELDFNEILKM